MNSLLARSLAAFWGGLALVMLGILLDPPRLDVAINPEAMD